MPVEVNPVGTELPGSLERHGGMDAILARFIARRRNHPALALLSADDDRLALQRRVEQFFHADEEGVHIDVEHHSHGMNLAAIARGWPAIASRTVARTRPDRSRFHR